MATIADDFVKTGGEYMKIQEAVKKETIHIAFGTILLCAVMMVIFVLLGKFDEKVLFGTLLGGTFAVLNFFLLGITIQRATYIENHGRAKAMIQFSYSMRMLATMGIGLIGFMVPAFNWVAVLCPLLFPRITIFFMNLAKSKRKEDL